MCKVFLRADFTGPSKSKTITLRTCDGSSTSVPLLDLFLTGVGDGGEYLGTFSFMMSRKAVPKTSLEKHISRAFSKSFAGAPRFCEPDSLLAESNCHTIDYTCNAEISKNTKSQRTFVSGPDNHTRRARYQTFSPPVNESTDANQN